MNASASIPFMDTLSGCYYCKLLTDIIRKIKVPLCVSNFICGT